MSDGYRLIAAMVPNDGTVALLESLIQQVAALREENRSLHFHNSVAHDQVERWQREMMFLRRDLHLAEEEIKRLRSAATDPTMTETAPP